MIGNNLRPIGEGQTWTVPRFDHETRARYSSRLRNLVGRCLPYAPSARASASELYTEILRVTQDGHVMSRNLARHMRRRPTLVGPDDEEHFEYRQDNYRLGMNIQQVLQMSRGHKNDTTTERSDDT